MKRYLKIYIYILAFLSFSIPVFVSDLSPNVLGQLGSFQGHSGTFEPLADGKSSLDTLSSALFLTTIYGARPGINGDKIIKFVDSLKKQQGYSDTIEKSVDLESVLNAILSYGYLGLEIPEKENLESYILSLYNNKQKMFSSQSGAPASIKSTYQAIQSLKILYKEYFEKNTDFRIQLNSLLSKAVSKSNDLKFFSFAKGGIHENFISNAYGILLGRLINYNFGEAKEWVDYFVKFVTPDGGFSAVPKSQVSDFYHSYLATRALSCIFKSTNTSLTFDYVLKDSFAKIANSASNLKDLFYINAAIVHTPYFKRLFDIDINYEVLHGKVKDNIVIGTKFRPYLSIFHLNQLVHNNFNINLQVFNKKSGYDKVFQLTYFPNNGTYAGDEFIDTNGFTGAVNFRYRFEVDLVTEELEHQMDVVKYIGYDIKMNAEGIFSDEVVSMDEPVPLGTEFKVKAKLFTFSETKEDLHNVDVLFEVLDSSLTLIHQQSISGVPTTQKISVGYQLVSRSTLPGAITFLVKVIENGIVNSKESLVYNVKANLHASSITFNKPSGTYKLGDTAHISIIPITLDGSGTLESLSALDYKKKSIVKPPKIFLDLYSESNRILSVAGISSVVNDFLKYSFAIPFESYIDLIGTYRIKFRYVTSDLLGSHEFAITRYDQKSGLVDEFNPLEINVDVNLVVKGIKSSSKGGSTQYGDHIKLNFAILDKVSGLTITLNQNRHSKKGSVFLLLGDQKNSSLIFDRKIAVMNDNKALEIEWVAGPSHKKDFLLRLIAENSAGVPSPILDPDSKLPWQLGLDVGGKIDFEHRIFTNLRPYCINGQVSVDFTLRNGKKALENANLIAQVKQVDTEETFVVPIGRALLSGSKVTYFTSWIITKEEDHAKNYIVSIYSFIDYNEKNPKPLFSIPVRYRGPRHVSPFRSESITLLLIITVFSYFSFQKWVIEKNSSQRL